MDDQLVVLGAFFVVYTTNYNHYFYVLLIIISIGLRNRFSTFMSILSHLSPCLPSRSSSPRLRRGPLSFFLCPPGFLAVLLLTLLFRLSLFSPASLSVSVAVNVSVSISSGASVLSSVSCLLSAAWAISTGIVARDLAVAAFAFRSRAVAAAASAIFDCFDCSVVVPPSDS